MKIPQAILELITKEEATTLVHFYGTEFYVAYLNKLKKKYHKLYKFINEVYEEQKLTSYQQKVFDILVEKDKE